MEGSSSSAGTEFPRVPVATVVSVGTAQASTINPVPSTTSTLPCTLLIKSDQHVSHDDGKMHRDWVICISEQSAAMIANNVNGTLMAILPQSSAAVPDAGSAAAQERTGNGLREMFQQFAWETVFERLKMTMDALCHTYLEPQRWVCFFCKLRTSKTRVELLKRIATLGCTVVQNLPQRFVAKDPNFSYLASNRLLTYRVGFEDALSMYGGWRATPSGLQCMEPGCSNEKHEHAVSSQLVLSRSLDSQQGKRKQSYGGSAEVSRAKKHASLHTSGTALGHKEASGSSSSSSAGEDEEDLASALVSLHSQRGDEGDEDDEESLTREQALSKMRGYRKLFRRKAREVEKGESDAKALQEQIEQLRSELQTSRDKGARFRTHLYRLVTDLSSPAAAKTSVKDFAQTNLVVTNYAGKTGLPATQGSLPAKREPSENTAAAYMGGLYSRPKPKAAVAV